MTLPPGDSGKRKLSEDKLLAYLEGRLSAAEQHEVELWLADEGMESDALEGLRTLTPKEIKHSVTQLNFNLHKETLKNRRRKQLNTDQFTWIAVVIVLFLIVIAFIVIRKSM